VIVVRFKNEKRKAKRRLYKTEGKKLRNRETILRLVAPSKNWKDTLNLLKWALIFQPSLLLLDMNLLKKVRCSRLNKGPD